MNTIPAATDEELYDYLLSVANDEEPDHDECDVIAHSVHWYQLNRAMECR